MNLDVDKTELPEAAIEFATQQFHRARSGDMALLAYVTAGLSPNLTNHEGNSLLMLACYHGHVELAKRLIELGADVNRTNDRGQTILSGCVFKGYDELIAALLDAGADPLAGTPSSLDAAKMFKREAYVQQFEEYLTMQARAKTGPVPDR